MANERSFEDVTKEITDRFNKGETFHEIMSDKEITFYRRSNPKIEKFVWEMRRDNTPRILREQFVKFKDRYGKGKSEDEIFEEFVKARAGSLFGLGKDWETKKKKVMGQFSEAGFDPEKLGKIIIAIQKKIPAAGEKAAKAKIKDEFFKTKKEE